MLVLRVLIFVAGASLVAWTLLSAIRTVVVPRSYSGVLSRFVFSVLLRIFRFLASERRGFEVRDRIMALYAPVVLVSLPVVWLTLVLVGYMGMFWAVEGTTWADAFHTSGSSLLTLGFAPVDSLAARVLAFTQAVFGLVLLALMIAFLPAMYNIFSRRETQVALLEVRAGSPPTAVEYLERAHQLGWLSELPEQFGNWETWFTELEETHTSYGALAFFRSPHAERSWVTAAGVVLDACSLTASTLDLPRHPQADLTIRAGYLALQRIADFYGVAFDPNPLPTDPISIIRAEFDATYDRLAMAGLPMRVDREQAWRDFSAWRVNYDKPLLDLAELTMAPYAPWTSDRSAPDRHRPQVRRWGRRRDQEPITSSSLE
ncbi:MAG: hypothetical protein ACE5MI_00170 [Acidimicrobiia bacterium]